MDKSSDSLFRQEAVEAKQQRLHGKVMIKLTMSSVALATALIATIFFAALWVGLGEYARTEQVRGILSTTKPSSKIIAPQTGVIVKLNVAEGQLVEKGDEIAIVDVDRLGEGGSAIAEASIDTINSRISLANRQREISGLLTATTQSQLRGTINNITMQIDDIQKQIVLQKNIVESNRSLFDKVETLVERGFVSQIDFEKRRQNLLNSQQTLSQLEQQAAVMQGERTRAQSDLNRLNLTASKEENVRKSTVEDLTYQRAQLLGQKAYAIVAPIAGRITAVQAAKGKRVGSNATLMTIIPEGSDLEAILYAPTRAIGFVKMGQETRLLLDAFPYQRFGSFEASISEVSRTVIAPSETDVPFEIVEPVYKVKAKLSRQSVNAFGENVSLQPGMTLTGNIVLERQSFLDWILTPLRAVVNRD